MAVSRASRARDALEHDPEKWAPVFRKDHAQIKEIARDDDSKNVITRYCPVMPVRSIRRGRALLPPGGRRRRRSPRNDASSTAPLVPRRWRGGAADRPATRWS